MGEGPRARTAFWKLVRSVRASDETLGRFDLQGLMMLGYAVC